MGSSTVSASSKTKTFRQNAVTKKNPNLTVIQTIHTERQTCSNIRVCIPQHRLYRHSTFIPRSKVPVPKTSSKINYFYRTLYLLLTLIHHVYHLRLYAYWGFSRQTLERISIHLQLKRIHSIAQRLSISISTNTIKKGSTPQISLFHFAFNFTRS